MERGKVQDIATKPVSAALFMVGAMLIIGAIDNVIVILAAEIGLWQFHFTRALIAIPLVIGLSLLGLGTIRPRRWWAVAVRSGLVATSMLFYFSALALMPISQALAGLFTSPIFILIITAGFLKHRIGPWRIGAVACGFAGILLVLQPDPNDLSWITLVPVAGGFFYALSAITTRTLCAGESTVAMLAGMWLTLGAMGAVGLGVMAIWPTESLPGPDGFVTRGWVWPMWEAAPYVVLQAFGSVVGVFLIIKAYQLGEPSNVSVFEYSVMIFGPFYAFVFFGQTMDQIQMLGIALILLAGTVIALRSGQEPA